MDAVRNFMEDVSAGPATSSAPPSAGAQTRMMTASAKAPELHITSGSSYRRW